ncbi:MAG: SMI1/KNR4 family protein [Capsulimonadaceae bacterium]
MDSVWKRIEVYLERTAPEMLAGLAPGATDSDLADYEAAVGVQLPDDVRMSLRRHNGQLLNDQGDPIGGTLIPCGNTLLSLSGMLYEWEDHRAISEDIGDENDPAVGNPGVKPFFLYPAWLPFAKDIGGDVLCIDLDPGEGGKDGQILQWCHEQDTPECVAPDFRTWLTGIVDGLEAGAYVYDRDSSFPGFFSPEDLE